MAKHLKTIAIAYIALLIGSAFALSMLGIERIDTGCYQRDALVWGAVCTGFAGSSVVAFILNMPLNLFYGPLFGVAGLFEKPFYAESLYALGLGAALWAPVVFLLWHWVKRGAAPNKRVYPTQKS